MTVDVRQYVNGVKSFVEEAAKVDVIDQVGPRGVCVS
jgi:hypothetical protein